MHQDVKIEYDVSTVMSLYAEKCESIKAVVNALPDKIVKYIYLRIWDKLYLFKLKLLFSKRIRGLEQYFHFDSLGMKEVNDIISRSKAIIDCPLPNQNGLTMRTFETLALGKKLITTNKNIVYYDFYSSNNIFVVDGKSKVPLSFFESEFDQNYKLSDEYSISNFVKKLTE